MGLKQESKRILQWIEEDFVVYFHWFLALAPIAAMGVGAFIHSGSHITEALLGIGATAVNFLLLAVRSWIEDNKELTLFRTFWYNTMSPPSEPAKELLFNTEIAIVEVGGESKFAEQANRKFQTKPKPAAENKREPDEDTRLRLRSVSCFCPEGELNEQQKQDKITELKNTLTNDLSSSEGVVVVRTEAVDRESWIIESVHEWASQHAEAPILVVRPQARKTAYEPNKLTDRFWWIRDNAKFLPWSLVKRAKDRGAGWQTQATYNRAMAINFFFLTLMVFVLGVHVVVRQSEEKAVQQTKNEGALGLEQTRHAGELRDEHIKAATVEDGMHEAIETAQRYENEVMKSTDDKLNVSYWFRKNGKPYVFVTTEKEDTQNFFENDSKSLIGCGFVAPGKVVQWQEKAKTRAFNFANVEDEKHGCVMDPRIEPIRGIVCAVYRPSGTTNLDATVGICVFTGTENKAILIGKYQKFLRDRTIAFYTQFHARIESGQVTALADRLELRKQETLIPH